MNTTLDNLKSKFHPYLLGHTSCPAKFKKEIDAVFQKPLQPLKGDNNPYIFDAGQWILKLGRTDTVATTPDTHLYRVRKAKKIRTYIQKNGLENHLVVPHKYIYWNEKKRRFYVVSEKIDLSSEVAEPASSQIERIWKSAPQLEGQIKALAAGNKQRVLTPIQSKALAKLSTLGYTDLTYNNLYFTEDGKVAIIDTEPVKRSLKKQFFVSKFGFAYWFGDKGVVLAQQTIAGIAKLKLYVADPDALREVQKVERNHALWSITKLVGKISLVALCIYFVPAATALIPIGILATTLKVTIIAVASLKGLILTINIASVCVVWRHSNRGLEGINQIVLCERLGVY